VLSWWFQVAKAKISTSIIVNYMFLRLYDILKSVTTVERMQIMGRTS